jgi:DNA-binding XRE family transcriptional regulator
MSNITAAQMRGARGLLGITQPELASAAGVSVETIKRLEGLSGPVVANSATVAVLLAAIDRLGVLLIDDDEAGPGVRLKA